MWPDTATLDVVKLTLAVAHSFAGCLPLTRVSIGPTRIMAILLQDAVGASEGLRDVDGLAARNWFSAE